jgi:hypothetical protein
LEVDHLLVGVVGGFQPDKLVKAFAGDDDGMYARFVFAWPEEAPLRELADDIGSIDENLKGALARLDALGTLTDDGALVVSSIRLSPTARSEFEQLRQFVYTEKQYLDGREREWLSKLPAHVLRLAGTLCLLDWAWNEGDAEPGEVDITYMRRAIKLVREYFWPHARAALRVAGVSDRHARARKVLRWIRAHGLQQISLQDIRRDALGQTVDEAGAKALLDTLTGCGWLRKTESPEPTPVGGRPAHRWDVNLKLVAETAETAETPPNGCDLQPSMQVSALSAVSASQPDFGADDPGPMPVFLDRNRRGLDFNTAPTQPELEEMLRHQPALGPDGESLDDFPA